jgi:hypothetical protein
MLSPLFRIFYRAWRDCTESRFTLFQWMVTDEKRYTGGERLVLSTSQRMTAYCTYYVDRFVQICRWQALSAIEIPESSGQYVFSVAGDSGIRTPSNVLSVMGNIVVLIVSTILYPP